jgi:hypothetical protein
MSEPEGDLDWVTAIRTAESQALARLVPPVVLRTITAPGCPCWISATSERAYSWMDLSPAFGAPVLVQRRWLLGQAVSRDDGQVRGSSSRRSV